MIAGLGPDFKGGVLVLVGLSGTGKGTTVDKLKQKIEGCVTWSNGNVGAPRGTLHAGRSTRGVCAPQRVGGGGRRFFFNTDVRSILMVLLGFQRQRVSVPDLTCRHPLRANHGRRPILCCLPDCRKLGDMDGHA